MPHSKYPGGKWERFDHQAHPDEDEFGEEDHNYSGFDISHGPIPINYDKYITNGMKIGAVVEITVGYYLGYFGRDFFEKNGETLSAILILGIPTTGIVAGGIVGELVGLVSDLKNK